jgi:hypothetical protein
LPERVANATLVVLPVGRALVVLTARDDSVEEEEEEEEEEEAEAEGEKLREDTGDTEDSEEKGQTKAQEGVLLASGTEVLAAVHVA